MAMFAVFLRGFSRGTHILRSRSRIAWFRAKFPGLSTSGPTELSKGVEIFAGRGSRLHLRDCRVGSGVMLRTAPHAVLEINADYVGPGSVIVARELVTIGAGTKIAEYVTIRDGNHDHAVPLRSMRFTSAPIVIEDDVWIGAKATILQGVRVGRGATVAAGAVVTRNVPPGATVGGIPARPIGE